MLFHVVLGLCNNIDFAYVSLGHVPRVSLDGFDVDGDGVEGFVGGNGEGLEHGALPLLRHGVHDERLLGEVRGHCGLVALFLVEVLDEQRALVLVERAGDLLLL